MSINYSVLQNTLFPAATTTPQTLRKSADGILLTYGKVVPADGDSGYAPGCIFIDTNGTASNVLYINDGTATSADFNSIKTVGNAYGTAGGQGPSPAVWGEVPVLDIMLNPQLGFVYFDDFLGQIDITSTDGWTITPEATGGITGVTTEQGGVLLVDSQGSAAAHDGVNAQLVNCMFLPADGVKIYFEARVKMNDATDEYFIGLSAVNTDIIEQTGGTLDTTNAAVGFFHHTGGTDDKISAVCGDADSQEQDADVAANTDGTYVKLGFVIDGLTRVDYYVNGVNVGNCIDTADIPAVVMCLSAVAQVAVTGADAELSVDWVRIASYKVAGGGRA